MMLLKPAVANAAPVPEEPKAAAKHFPRSFNSTVWNVDIFVQKNFFFGHFFAFLQTQNLNSTMLQDENKVLNNVFLQEILEISMFLMPIC